MIRIGNQDISERGSGGSVPDPVGQAVHELLARVAGLEKHVLGLEAAHHVHADSDGSDWTIEDDVDFVI